MNYDFSHYSNVDGDPLRSAQLAEASKIDLETIKVLSRPLPACGFFSGYARVEYQGKQFEVFVSSPHEAGSEQADHKIKHNAALDIAGRAVGYIRR